jgi:hypothetical protein
VPDECRIEAKGAVPQPGETSGAGSFRVAQLQGINRQRMNRHERIRRLRFLAGRLESQPRSHARDEVLRSIRERIVLLETGEQQSTAWSGVRSTIPRAELRFEDLLR